MRSPKARPQGTIWRGVTAIKNIESGRREKFREIELTSDKDSVHPKIFVKVLVDKLGRRRLRTKTAGAQRRKEG